MNRKEKRNINEKKIKKNIYNECFKIKKKNKKKKLN